MQVAAVVVVAAARAVAVVDDEDGVQWRWRGGVQWRQQRSMAAAVGATDRQ